MNDDRKREALERAQHAVRRSETFQRFVDDPDIKAFFDAYERDCINQMLRAAPTDDDTRRAQALRANAMRELRSFLSSAVVSGERALKTLMKDVENG